jgi:hypothetical protein
MSSDRGLTAIVHLRVPIFDEFRSAGPGMIFAKWLPGLAGPPWNFNQGQLVATLWFDNRSSNTSTPEDAKRYLNNSAHHLNIDVKLDISADLADFIWRNNGKNLIELGTDSAYSNLAAESGRLAEKVLRFGIAAYNKLVDYVRTEKQQYWLNRWKFDEVNPSQISNRFFPTISFPDSKQYVGNARFDAVSNVIKLITDADFLNPEGPKFAIRAADGTSIQDFIGGSSKLSSVLEFLANAKELLWHDHPRSAIIEATAAIEIAINRFFQTSSLNQQDDLMVPEHIDLETVTKSLSRIGLGNSIKFLLPLTLPPSILPQTLIDRCYQLYELRNKTVHEEKRNFQGIALDLLIDSAEQLCRVLSGPGTRPTIAREWQDTGHTNA